MERLISPQRQAPATAVNSPNMVSLMENADEEDWDAYLENSPGNLPTLLSSWKHILEKTYGYSCYFLIARHEANIKGIMPLYEVKSKIFGHRLETMPGAMMADSPEAATALISTADNLARELNADTLVLRDSRVDWTTAVPDLKPTKLELHRGVIHNIESDEESAWQHINKSCRKDIRRRQTDEKLQIILDTSGIQEFHTTFLTFTQQVSTPCFSLAFLQNVIGSIPDRYQVVRIIYDGKVIASYFNLLLGKTIFGIWGASLYDYRNLNPTDKAIWAIIKWGIQQGYTTFDLGRSAFPSPQFQYKSRYADVDYPIYQLFRVYRGKPPGYLQAHQLDEDTGPVSMVRKFWPHLPRKVVKFLGPEIRKHIPFG